MSRRRNAIITAIFTYGQSALGMVLGLVVTRIVLIKIGRDLYGLWVASGALLAYAGFADLGVLGVLPWMIAEADGKKDEQRLRALVAHGLVFSLIAGCAFAVIAAGLWHFYPALLHLNPNDRATLIGPLFVVIALTAFAFPFRTFSALLTGKQDALALGIFGLTQVILSVGLTLALALLGNGLYALAIGSALPPLLSAIAAFWRSRRAFYPLLTRWVRPQLPLLRRLAVDGFGVWLISFGYTMAAATDPVILSFVGLRDAVPAFAISTRLALTLTQFAWILPDAALVGLAQLSTEGTKERVREIALAILLLNMIVGGAVATAVLASNGAFVRVWVGADYFLGARFNAILAINVILACLVHGLGSIVAVLGKRLEMGVALIGNGVIHIVLATILSKHIGVYGVVLATFASGALTCLPVAMTLAHSQIGSSSREIVGRALLRWGFRFVPLGIGALFLGKVCTTRPLVTVVPLCAAFGLSYLWWMKPLYAHVPLGPRVTRLLQRVHLVP